jgi:hypothetical protein
MMRLPAVPATLVVPEIVALLVVFVAGAASSAVGVPIAT